MSTRRLFMHLVSSVLLALTLAPAARAQNREVVIFAAASLKTALDEIAGAWAAQSGEPAPKISYAASNTLAKQIEQGAPADLFLSADLDWMDYAGSKNLLKAESRTNLLANRIALIAGKEAAIDLKLAPGADLAAALAGGRLAMANVEAVPAGKYGKAALEKLGLWAGVKDRIAQADNVRAALLLVSRGEAPLGIVYTTDAAADPRVKVIATFPEDAHPPIIYPAAVTRDSANPAAGRLLDYLKGAAAAQVFARNGFVVLTPASKAGG
jgi:molybdate transport system substrate-binding protein